MIQFLLDTDHLTLLEHGHPPLKHRLGMQPQGSIGLTVVTAPDELLVGDTSWVRFNSFSNSRSYRSTRPPRTVFSNYFPCGCGLARQTR